MSFSKLLVASLPALLAFQTASALPAEKNLEDRQCTGCTPPPDTQPDYYCPVIDVEENITGESWQVGASAKSGSNIATGQSYTVGSSWTIGGSLGLSFEKVITGSASLSAEVSESIEITVSTQVESTCPEGGDFFCSLLVYPGMRRVKGHMEFLLPGAECPLGAGLSEGEWEMVSPRKDKSNLPFYTTDLCTCGNLEGVDGPGHPEKVCREDCVVPARLKGTF
ncbi:hypothetical protein FSHL1_006814 [Fusarium sambucinum]